ncbi:hypothetical protein QI633_20715 [Nocardioides sp. QY071]|uniref:hypothetical protein n=1 Tax=Nocardioides sp. QY071 TaxID=3044187 RepID=UPI00249C8395|nr:hypothetical protein [Nocardioides sp. QY071]WGY00951.1 hypothetical protein QI633_20715 [Nocardioides sp. QY071]
MTFLLATYRYDGALLLELLADWYSVLATAETEVADVEANQGILAGWADGAGLRPAPRRFRGPSLIRMPGPEVARDYGRGFAVPVTDADAVAARTARRLRETFRQAQERADARLAGGAYLAVLSGYVDRLRGMRDDPAAYRRVEHTLVAIMADERYLRIAVDERARDLVAAIDDELSHLYGRCMDLERGGQAR